MPFGLTNAPATFQSLMNYLFAKYNRKFVVVFFDDILVFSETLEEHKEHLKEVFKVLRENQLTVNLAKCSFGQTKVEYLGHVIQADGVATDPTKITAVTNWPAPSNITELRGFLGLAGYYRRFIQGYGVVGRPLFDALKKDSFQWSAPQEQAFQELKQRLTKAPVLALPNYTKPFVLEADASGYGLGAVLMQEGRPIAYMSKSLGPKAQTLSTYDKETMAILEALKKWKHYFAGSSLIIRTDQESLKYIHEQKLTQGIQHKLLVKLLGYNYTIEYKKGRENKAADALSRVRQFVGSLTASSAVPLWITEVVKSYSLDTKYRDIIAELALDAQAHPQYTYKHGILRYKNKIVIGNNTSLRQDLIQTFHKSELGGHSGERATYQRIHLLFHWSGLQQDVIAFVKACPVCQINKSEHTPYPGLLQPLPIPDFAWCHISMDFVEGLPVSENKNLILVVVDRFTKYAHFLSMKHPITVQSVARMFSDNIFKLHGLPSVIVTDRDKIFTSSLWQKLFKTLGIKLHMSTSYHPQSDGQTKRVNQCLENYLRCMAFQQPTKWHS